MAANLKKCAGCGEDIPDGGAVYVNVTSGQHTISVISHNTAECREMAYNKTMARSDWKRNPTYKSS